MSASAVDPKSMDPPQTGPQPVLPGKANPETLVLRATPRRIVRFKRGAMIGGVGAGSFVIAGVAWLALEPRALNIVEAAEGQIVSERKTPADAVVSLPANYGKVTPQLGPPLPGDLGRSILERQRQLGLDPGAYPEGPAATPGTGATPEQQAAEAERLRIAAQARQAREAGVMVQSSRLTAASAPVATMPDAAVGTASGDEAGRLAIDPERDQNNQEHKLDFIGRSVRGGIYNAHALQVPASPYQLMAGSVIAASLITGLNSDLPGMVVAQVTENVFDTVTGRTLLIPQGARLIGGYDSVVAFGQRRALLVWQRIILPDGSSIQIDSLPAADAAGYAGLEDRVDFHSWALLKGVVLSTLLSVGTELSLGSDENDLVRAIRESAQQSTSQAGQQIVTKQLNVQPTIRVRPGWPLRVIVHKDLVLRPWRG